MSRRTLCVGTGAAAVMLALGGLKLVTPNALLRPPGGQDEERLIAGCNRCQKCYEVCPRHVIAPAHLEDGVLVVRTPEMSFSSNYCDYCAQENGGNPLCVAACPTEALSLPAGATAQSVIMGKAVINADWCLAYHLIGCRFCYDVCPYDAIDLDATDRPIVDTFKCNGCGACEAVCVSLTEGSISVGATSRAVTIQPVDA